ncbi:DUF6286 domain-containing protein [Aldersonia sp. NBC_00410]|uniref:DUF6286 domain-containing protein n=1 Tax=Aldersonia sp. NBC_00410 TaxID=2975954 RepID=UPI00224EC89C|nr:DUF6286 domain-containing protein [Aldersonia sp. NBC_00410]MCX5042022.1 DUF6286 domain-containing protein [Aldersonia sp. NBC_00410]
MSSTDPVAPGQRPRRTPAAAPIAIVAAIALIAAGVIAGRELLIENDIIDEAPWVANTFGWISRLTWQTWMLPAAIGAVLVGLCFVAAAMKPRARTHVGTVTSPTLWLTTTDTARASTAAALHVEGVVRAHTTADRRTVRVHIVSDETAPDVIDSVTHRVQRALGELDPSPIVRVSVDRPGSR